MTISFLIFLLILQIWTILQSNMDYIEKIKAKGYSQVKVVDTFDDGEFCQVEFKDEINCSHTACFRNRKLLIII